MLRLEIKQELRKRNLQKQARICRGHWSCNHSAHTLNTHDVKGSIPTLIKSGTLYLRMFKRSAAIATPMAIATAIRHRLLN